MSASRSGTCRPILEPRGDRLRWETGGKAPQRTWTIMADGSGLRPLYPEAPYEWITHEAVIGKDEVVFAMARMAISSPVRPGRNRTMAARGRGKKPTGVGVINLRTRQMRIVGQVPLWSGGRSTGTLPDRPTAAGPPPTTSSMRSGSTTGTTARSLCWPAPERWRGSHSPDVQRRRHEDRGPVRPDLQGSKVFEHLHRPVAQERAQSDV